MSARTDPRGGYQATGVPTATAAERDTEANQNSMRVLRVEAVSTKERPIAAGRC
jgi:hypothetical protein